MEISRSSSNSRKGAYLNQICAWTHFLVKEKLKERIKQIVHHYNHLTIRANPNPQ